MLSSDALRSTSSRELSPSFIGPVFPPSWIVVKGGHAVLEVWDWREPLEGVQLIPIQLYTPYA